MFKTIPNRFELHSPAGGAIKEKARTCFVLFSSPLGLEPIFQGKIKVPPSVPLLTHSRLRRYLKITSYTPCFEEKTSVKTILNCFNSRFPAGGANEKDTRPVSFFFFKALPAGHLTERPLVPASQPVKPHSRFASQLHIALKDILIKA